jgi:magnesium chelatase subunit D
MVDFDGVKKASHGQGGDPSFADIVGQDDLKRALLAVAANHDLDGLLIQGEKGTAKSTAVRALANHLPEQTVIEDCPYGCPPDRHDSQCTDCRDRDDPPTGTRSVPLVTLPLGATRERVVGTLSVADALAGDYEFDPGLLARANRGILYVDEVNLLDDHLVDVLLDAAASGINRVERDGVSVSHPASFTLVGTMNPEEGELRPQLRDRFALQATVTACEDIDQRVSIIDRALGHGARETTEHGDLDGDSRSDGRRRQLRRARQRLDDVDLPAEFTTEIAQLCRDAGVDGHRGDIATARTARTLAALDDRSKVIESDVRRAAELALPHRFQSRPFEDAPDPDDHIDDHFEDDEGEGENGDSQSDGDQPDEAGTDDNASDDSGGADDTESSASDSPGSDDAGEESPDDAPSPQSGEAGATGDEADAGDGDQQSDTGDEQPDEGDEQTEGTPLVPGQSSADIGAGRAPDIEAPVAAEAAKEETGNRSHTRPSVDSEGPRVRTTRADSSQRIDAAASVRAATARGGSTVKSRDLRQSVRQRDTAALVVFAVDASASMQPAMREAKGTVLELLKDAYQQRDEVAFVTFAGEDAEVLLPPTDSVTLAARHLKELPTGDRTPLPAGLHTASAVLERADPTTSVVVLVTDGRANVAAESPVRETREAAKQVAESGAHILVIDAGEDDHSGLTTAITDVTGGERIPLSSLTAGRIDAAVGTARET